jgi:hypothetical protein
VADVTLMSTFHYYIDINAWIKYLDRLIAKTCSVIVISRPMLKNDHWRAQADPGHVIQYFERWGQQVDFIYPPDTDDDPAPRELYAVRYDSPLIKRVPIDSIDLGSDPKTPMHAAMMALAQLIATGQPFDAMTTDYAQQWRKRKAGAWSDRVLRRFVNLKCGVMESVRDVGQIDPFIVQRETMKLSDGGHRLCMLKAMGYKSAIVRPV